MNKQEFIKYANELLSDECMEPLYEQIAEFNGEVARFGDAGPGAGLRIRESIRQVKGVERQLARLEGRAPRDFYFRVRLPD